MDALDVVKLTRTRTNDVIASNLDCISALTINLPRCRKTLPPGPTGLVYVAYLAQPRNMFAATRHTQLQPDYRIVITDNSLQQG
jgi:hypothetical protein